VGVPNNAVAALDPESVEDFRRFANYQVLVWCYAVIGTEVSSYVRTSESNRQSLAPTTRSRNSSRLVGIPTALHN